MQRRNIDSVSKGRKMAEIKDLFAVSVEPIILDVIEGNVSCHNSKKRILKLGSHAFLNRIATVFCCVCIIVFGITFLTKAEPIPVITSIGENISTNNLSLGGAVTSGSWLGNIIDVAHGGTGLNLASIVKGSMLFFSDTGILSALNPGNAGQVLTSGGTGVDPSWQTVARSATFVVAASDSAATSKKQADYVCDGTDDQVEIQTAIDALPANGGSISLSEGTYSLTDSINLSSNSAIKGQGSSTILQGVNRPINISSVSNVKVSDLALNGASSFADGIYVYGGLNITIQGCYIYSYASNGVYFAKGSATPAQGSLIMDNYIHDIGNYLISSTGTGVYLQSSDENYSEYIKVSNNNISHNGTGIKIAGNNNAVIGNILDSNNVGVISSASRTQIADNTINHSKTWGVFINNASSWVTVANNNIVHSGQEGLSIYGTVYNNLILGNHIYSNGDSNTNDDHDTEIRISSTSNIHTFFSNNDIGNSTYDANAGSCVYIANSLVSGLYFLNNIFENQGGAGYYFAGWASSGVTIRGNVEGYLTENSGTSTITTGATSITVTHGLASAPTRVQLTPTTDTAGKRYWISAKTATTFTITIDSAHTSDISFDWRATVGEGN